MLHYTRTPGPRSTVAVVDRPPAGTPLHHLLQRGRPPVGVALDLLAGACELVHLAHEDGQVHGDLHAGTLRLTDQGVLTLSGFSAWAPATGDAPRPGDGPFPEDDLYGLGRLGAALLAPGGIDLAPPPDRHDEHVIEVLVAADLEPLPARARNDVRWFVVHLLACDPCHRPDALRVWRSLAPLAAGAPGPSLAAWAAEALGASAPPGPRPPRPTPGALPGIALDRFTPTQLTLLGAAGTLLALGALALAAAAGWWWTRT